MGDGLSAAIGNAHPFGGNGVGGAAIVLVEAQRCDRVRSCRQAGQLDHDAPPSGSADAVEAVVDEDRDPARHAEQVESVQRAADGMASTVTAMAEGARRTVSTTQETLRAGLGTASEIAQRSTDHVVELFSFSGKRTQDAAAQAAEGLQAVAQSSTALVRGFQEVSRECLAMTQSRLKMNVEALTAISRHVRTLQSGNPFKRRQDTGERSSDQPPEQVEVHSELAPYHRQHEHEAEHDQKSESF